LQGPCVVGVFESSGGRAGTFVSFAWWAALAFTGCAPVLARKTRGSFACAWIERRTNRVVSEDVVRRELQRVLKSRIASGEVMA
jgi:hypothetical protein